VILEAMNENVVAFDASDGVLNGDPDLANGAGIGLLLRGKR